METPDPNLSIEDRLRRDADRARRAPSAELRGRILAGLQPEQGDSLHPRRPSAWRPAALAAALVLLLGAVWIGALDPLGRSGSAGPVALGGGGGGALAPVEAEQPHPGPTRPAPTRALPVGERVRGWASSSSMVLRSTVDEPLRRELRAISIDLTRVVDSILVGLPEVLARPFDGLF